MEVQKETNQGILTELATIVQDEFVGRVEKGENSLYLYLVGGKVFKIEVSEVL